MIPPERGKHEKSLLCTRLNPVTEVCFCLRCGLAQNTAAVLQTRGKNQLFISCCPPLIFHFFIASVSLLYLCIRFLFFTPSFVTLCLFQQELIPSLTDGHNSKHRLHFIDPRPPGVCVSDFCIRILSCLFSLFASRPKQICI